MSRREAMMVGASEQHLRHWEARAAASGPTGGHAAYRDRLFLAIAHYSAGSPLDVVRAQTRLAVAHLEAEGIAPLALADATEYYAALWGLSLSMLFGDPSPAFGRLLGGQDLLIDRLLSLTGHRDGAAAQLLHSPNFQHLVDAIAAPKSAATAIADYLRGWYAAMGTTPWHDTHLAGDPGFFGYWAFELAAVVKALDIPDAPFASNIYHARDLVHQRLYRTWLDGEEGIEERKAKAALDAPAALDAARKALGAFFEDDRADLVDGSAVARGMRLVATLLGLEPEALRRDPKLIMVALLQIFSAARSLSQQALDATEGKSDTQQLKPAFEAITQQLGGAGADLERDAATVAGADAAIGDQSARMDAARARLQNIRQALDGLLKEEKAGGAALVGGLERLVAEFAGTLGLQPAKPRDIQAEVSEQVGKALDEANRKNMIGDDFDWSSLWRKS